MGVKLFQTQPVLLSLVTFRDVVLESKLLLVMLGGVSLLT